MVDTADSKSAASNSVRVRVSPAAPIHNFFDSSLLQASFFVKRIPLYGKFIRTFDQVSVKRTLSFCELNYAF